MEFKKIKFVYPIDNYKIIAFFTDGKKKIFDVKLLIDKYEPFKALEKDPKLFFSARVAPGGYAAVYDGVGIVALGTLHPSDAEPFPELHPFDRGYGEHGPGERGIQCIEPYAAVSRFETGDDASDYASDAVLLFLRLEDDVGHPGV